MNQDIVIGDMVFPGSEIAAEYARLKEWPELFIEGRANLPMVDFRLIESKLLIKGEITSHTLEIKRAFGLQMLAATELVKERFEGGQLECRLDLPLMASFFEALIARFIQILALWAFQEKIELKFVCQLYSVPELNRVKILSYVDAAWKANQNTVINDDPGCENLVSVEEILPIDSENV